MKSLSQHISQVKMLHSLNEFIEEKLYYRQVYEKLIINKDYKMNKIIAQSLNDVKAAIFMKLEDDKFDGHLDLRDIDVSDVTSLYELFSNISTSKIDRNQIKTIDITDWNTENVENMWSMFVNLRNLQYIYGIENLNTGKCNDMGRMFDNCQSLKKLDLSKWNVSSVINYTYF